jgi:hypothetical protein
MARTPAKGPAAPKAAAKPSAAPAAEGAANTSPAADQAAATPPAAPAAQGDQSQTVSGDAASRELGASSAGATGQEQGPAGATGTAEEQSTGSSGASADPASEAAPATPEGGIEPASEGDPEPVVEPFTFGRELNAESLAKARTALVEAMARNATDLAGEFNDPVFAVALENFLAAGEQVVAAYLQLADAAEGKPATVLLMQAQRLAAASGVVREAEYAAHERLAQIYSAADEIEEVALKVRSKDGKPYRRAGFQLGDTAITVYVDPIRAERLRSDPNVAVQEVWA